MFFDATLATSRQISSGILWTAILFASVTTLGQSWTREQTNFVLDALRMSPAPSSAFFLGKAITNTLFLLGLESVMSPVFLVLFRLHINCNPWLFALVLPLGTWALVVNGTFFSLLNIRTRNRELLLPLLLIPISLPALLAMIESTAGAFSTGDESTALRAGITQLVAYDTIYTTVCLLLFDTILNSE